MNDATRKTRTIEKKLKSVEALPVADEAAFYNLSLNEASDDNSDEI